MGKKRKQQRKKRAMRKHGNVLKLPVRRIRTNPMEPDRKLSDIIQEMGLLLFEDPDTASFPAIQTAMLLASTAWNAALGSNSYLDHYRERLEEIEGDDGPPWLELVSPDTDRLIAELVEYKQSHYPHDRRLLITTEMCANGNLRVQWADEDKLVAAPFGTRPSKAAPARAKSGTPIAAKLVAKMKREAHNKVVNLQSVIAGRAAAEELQKTVVTQEGLAGLHPAHAVYVYAQNQSSVMAEQLTALDELTPFTDIVAKAEDIYMPSGPPMSPLTASYFTCWAVFDAWVGPAHETIGTTVLEVGETFGMHTELLRLIRLMQESRMGLYIHEGTEGGLTVLRELVTDAVCHAVVPAGCRGKKGELWYTRVLPPPTPDSPVHVVFTTPYLLLQPGLHAWQAYFRRVLPDAPSQDRLEAYAYHMKYGPTHAYWNDFVFEGYVNHRTDTIYLEGLPDIPESRPHSEVNT